MTNPERQARQVRNRKRQPVIADPSAEVHKLWEENAKLRSRLLSVENLCPFCKENVAELLCDATLGIESEILAPAILGKSPKGRRIFKHPYEAYTCDLPICESCRTQALPIFFCGKDSSVLVPDFCPIHRGCESLDSGAGPIAEEEAIAWRNRAKIVLQMDGATAIQPFPSSEAINA